MASGDERTSFASCSVTAARDTARRSTVRPQRISSAAIENAFWHFGGVPKVLVIDNLKAAVKQPDWYDPELTPKIQSFCEHYGVTILPTKPRTPRHKGKIESGVGYVQDNGLKGHRFTSLAGENDHLAQWEASVADTRIHGTIRKQVGKLFQEVERRRCCRCRWSGSRSFTKNSGSCIVTGTSKWPRHTTPCRRSTWAARSGCDGTCGWCEFSTDAWSRSPCMSARNRAASAPRINTSPAEKRSGVERGAVYLLSRARLIGEHTARWAENMLKTRGIEGVRVLQGLLSLIHRHDTERIERACEVAFSHGAWRLRTIRELLKRDAPRTRDLRVPSGASDHSPFERLREAGGHVVRASSGEGPEAPTTIG